jgi:hypothetical protein
MITIKNSETDKKGIIYSPNIPMLLLNLTNIRGWSVVVTDPRSVMKADQSFEPLKKE